MTARSTPSNYKRSSRAEPPKVSAAFLEFTPIRKPVLRYALHGLPVVAVLMAVIGLVGHDPMYASGMACVAGEIIIFRALLDRLPATFHALWIQDIIVHGGSVPLGDERSAQSINDAEEVSPTPQSKSRIVLFMGELDRRLNSQAQWVFGVLIGTIPAIWRLIYFNKNREFLTARPFDHLVTSRFFALAIGFAAFVAESIIAIFIGLLVWRLLAIGVGISGACNALGLTPRPQHPDRCGGFKPLGHLCMIMAFVVTIPGVFLAMWILLAPRIVEALYGRAYTGLDELLLTVMLILATISFLWPLWSVHKVLVEESNLLKRDLDRLGRRISNLAADILRASEAGTYDDCEKMKKSLDFLRQVYEDNKRFPLWPFDVQTTTTFLLSQAIPAITLIKEIWKLVPVGHH